MGVSNLLMVLSKRSTCTHFKYHRFSETVLEFEKKAITISDVVELYLIT